MAVIKRERLNNLQLSYQRNELVYEAVMTDLYLMGVIPKDICEAFTGRKVSESVKLPPAAQELEDTKENQE
jgi:hypothetical protein